MKDLLRRLLKSKLPKVWHWLCDLTAEDRKHTSACLKQVHRQLVIAHREHPMQETASGAKIHEAKEQIAMELHRRDEWGN